MKFRRFLSAITMFAFLVVNSLSAQAAMIGSSDYVNSADRAANMEIIDARLQRTEVQKKFTEMGISMEDAQARIARLPDAELADLANNMEKLPAGEGVVGVIGIVFVVLIILEFTGVIDIFKNA